jgi:centrosomal CEP192-like protein/ASPM-SPD-2-Hydin domain-containing protein
MLSFVAIGACEIDSRELHVRESGLAPGGDGSGGGLLVQPSSVAYGPITLAFAASARFLVENTGTATLDAPLISLEGDGASAFILTQNDCTAALPRGAYCGVAVAFRPRDASVRDATLTITGSERTFEVPLSGSGLEAGGLLLQAAPGSSEALFGEVPLQGEQEATLQLSNPTETPSGLVELISNNVAFRLLPAQGSECASTGAQLAGGQSCNFRVRFAPALRGVTDATITARSPGLGSVSMGVSGRALAPARLLVDPARLEFGDVVVGGAAVLDLALSNVGDEPLPPVTGSVTGEAAGDFRVSENDCSEPLPTRETCSMKVSFSPRATGPHAAVLGLGAGVGSLGVDLTGAGLAAGNLLVTAAQGGSFGSVALGTVGEQALRVSNTSVEVSGPITLTVNSADFSIVPPGGSECLSGVTNLAGGAGCDARVRFAPTQRGQRNATLTVSSRVGGAALNLSGAGLAPAEIRTDGAVDFGGVSQGGTATRSLTISNAGDEPAPSLSTRISGLDGASFSVQSNGCVQGLGAQGSCALSLLFTPATAGSQLATLTLEGAPGDTRDVTLSGTGLAPALLGVQPSPLVFDSVAVGQTQRAVLTVTNTGAANTGRVSASMTAPTASFAITYGVCPPTLATGESCEIAIVFAPTAAGLSSGALRVTSTPAGTLEVPVSGTATAGPGNLASNLVIVGAESTYFGSIGLGESAIRAFTLRNTGDLSAGTLVDLTLGSNSSFSLVPRAATECEPGVTLLDGRASCDLRVLFQPATTGTLGATLAVSSTIGGTTNAFLTGTGTGTSPAALTGSASALTFVTPSPVDALASDETLDWTVRNTGGTATEPLVLTHSNMEEFPVLNRCLVALEGGAECRLTFQLAPIATGLRTAVVTVSAGALSTSVTVSGTGY